MFEKLTKVADPAISRLFQEDMAGINANWAYRFNSLFRRRARDEIRRLYLQILESHGILKATALLRAVYDIWFTESEGGKFREELMYLYQVPELIGLDFDVPGFLHEISEKYDNADNIRGVVFEISTRFLRQQLSRGDTFLLDTTLLKETPLVTQIPAIVDLREKEMANACVHQTNDGLFGLVDFYSSALGFRLLLNTGTPTRVSQESLDGVKELLVRSELLDEVGLIEQDAAVLDYHQNGAIDYSSSFKGFSPSRERLFNGILQSMDPDSWTSEMGLRSVQDSASIVWEPVLQKKIKSDMSSIKVLSAEGLGHVVSQVALSDMLVLFDELDTDGSMKIAQALQRIGVKETVPLVQKLAQIDGKKIDAAMTALSGVTGDLSAKAVLDLLKKVNGIDRLKHVPILGKTRSALVVPYLIHLLLFDKPALISISNPLLQVILSGHYGFQQQEVMDDIEKIISRVRENAADALGALGEIAVEPILFLLSELIQTELPGLSESFKSTDLYSDLRNQYTLEENHGLSDARSIIFVAIKALGLTRSEKSIEALVELTKHDDHEIVTKAMAALADIDVPALDALLKVDTCGEVQLKASKIHYLSIIHSSEVTEILVESTRNDNELVRAMAYGGLALRQSSSAIRALERICEEPSDELRSKLAFLILSQNRPEYRDIVSRLRADPSPIVRNAIMAAVAELHTVHDDEIWA